jgi:hypothetical protein
MDHLLLTKDNSENVSKLSESYRIKTRLKISFGRTSFFLCGTHDEKFSVIFNQSFHLAIITLPNFLSKIKILALFNYVLARFGSLIDNDRTGKEKRTNKVNLMLIHTQRLKLQPNEVNSWRFCDF